MSIDSHRAEPYVGLAIAYAYRGKPAELDTTLIEAEKAVPDNLAPYYQAGRVLYLQGIDYARRSNAFASS